MTVEGGVFLKCGGGHMFHEGGLLNSDSVKEGTPFVRLIFFNCDSMKGDTSFMRGVFQIVIL